MSKPVVAVDLDEVRMHYDAVEPKVLGKLVFNLAEFHNALYGTFLTVESFHSYRFCEVWCVDR